MKKLYSPAQIFSGTYLGGPLAALYFLKGNFEVLGNESMSNKTVQLGAATLEGLHCNPSTPYFYNFT